MRSFGWTFFGLGVAFIAAALLIWAFGAAFRLGAVQTTGTVVEVELRQFSDGNAYCPVVRYTTRSGRDYTHYSNICSWPASYEQGQDVRVYYDPQDPEHVQINDFMGIWFLPLLFGFMGLVFAPIGFFAIFPNVISSWFPRKS